LKITGYLILGAGLAGLSAAHHLKKGGCNDWLILEGSERAGGLCKSLKSPDGFTFDQSIHILFSSDSYASGLIRRLLNGNMTIQKRESWVYSKSIYTPYPWQANTYGLPAQVIKECLMGVIKATYERDGRPEPANFEEWCQWAIDLREMTDAWIKDRVMTPSLSEVIDGALHRQEKAFGPNSVFWYPKRGGIEALPKGFLPYLDQDIMFFNTEVSKIFWRKKRIVTTDGREWCYDRLISSLPLPVLAGYIEPELPLKLKEASGRLEYNVVYAVNLAVQRDSLSPYHWVYFPEEQYLLHRISFPKNFSPGMVPDGWSSITAEVSASKYRRVPSGDELVRNVVADLKHTGMVSDSDVIEVKSVLTLSPAYVIYNHTHRLNVDRLHQFFKENNIFPCGRFGEWEYLNMDHSILSGKKAVEEIMEKE
jgi:UDP-galactopyranose mutase